MGQLEELLRQRYYRLRFGASEGQSKYQEDLKLRLADKQIATYGGDSLKYWVSCLPDNVQGLGAQLAAEYADIQLEKEKAVRSMTEKTCLKALTEEEMLHRRRLAAQLVGASEGRARELQKSIEYLDEEIARNIEKLTQVEGHLEKKKLEIRRAESLYKARLTVFCLHYNVKTKPGSVTP